MFAFQLSAGHDTVQCNQHQDSDATVTHAVLLSEMITEQHMCTPSALQTYFSLSFPIPLVGKRNSAMTFHKFSFVK